MTGPLLTTKMFVPRPKAGTLVRARVSDLLDQGVSTKLTLVAAQAGFGKTTALANWVHQRCAPGLVAWLSLDSGDTDPATFWTYVVTALSATNPDIGSGVLPLLEGAGRPTPAMLTELLNRLAELEHDVVLVLDDYHLADGPDIAEAVTFLLTHLPPQAHLVLSTRTDPSLPLSRLRARGELVEIRAADLRFTNAEATSYLHGAGVDLDPPEAAILESRTEGWAAALQLAVLSLQDRTDVADFLADFAGDDRFIVDYLVEEVLSRQPRDVREFLLRTSILERLTGPLCDAVTGHTGGGDTLQQLERENLFVIPLDARRQWYRYHHLFADVLRAHAATDPAGTPLATLHLRASAWYDADERPVPAVRHALSAGDPARAAALMETAMPRLLRDRQEATIVRWVDAVPADVVSSRPALAMGFIAGLMAHNDVSSVPARLDELDALLARLAAARAAEPVVLVEDPTEVPRLPGKVQLYRAAYALVTEDLDGTQRHVALATAAAAPDDHPTRAGAWGLSGLAHWRLGDIEATHQCYSRCVEELLQAGHLSDVLGCTTTLADIRITQGRLSDATRTLQRTLALTTTTTTTTTTEAVPRGTADMHAGLAGVALERGQLDDAESHLRRAQELGEAAGMPQHASQVRVTMALARAARGDVNEALTLLEEAERLYVPDFKPDVRPVHATRARLLIGQGRLDEARAWAATHQLRPDDELTYVREHEHITLATLLLAESRGGQAQHLDELRPFLARLHAASDAGGRHGTLVEIAVLEACAALAAGDHQEAGDHLRLALRLSGPERFTRPFTDHAGDLPRLVQLLTPEEQQSAWVGTLLAACTPEVPPTAQARVRPPRQDLVDPLSQRELEVLRLLATDLSGPELARHLVVSLNTVRTHTRNVYGKLGVSGRRAAVSRARELNLLSRQDE
ncbi:LuxR family transcriptional regulator, maltose regulon positive regulatory protein [Pedococcus cremeus]|uniref:LuxR family transcriptional regulator, maltose regulon positive regulatory protein n=1 Tax=Pedococcus cremeus TaxID=587636 RepID=A0A1H9XS59_9MICO|nr:LuxR C-terminal-related transcriptional regulator [Pedococcus cremeus]SES48990.1 LuxR family transcriptional regulator, maltose regulon positive regulatory protein [Pedococcus cremeus]